MKLSEKMSYLKGLLDGMEIDTTTKEGKALVQMTEVMQEMTNCINDLQAQVDELSELCDILDSDLGEVEEDLYFNSCECDCDCDDDCECDCDCDCECDDDFDDFDFENDELYEVCCPECGDTVILDEYMLEEGSIDCPNCGSSLEFDFDDVELIEEVGDEAEE